MLKEIKENTVASYKKTVNRINIAKLIINGVFQLFFLFYYIYLIYTHKDSLGYLVCYSILLGVLVVSFIIEILLMNKIDDTKEEKKDKKAKRKKTKNAVKIIKYLIKFATICIAFADIKANGGTPNAILLMSFSVGVFTMQIMFSIIIHLLKKSFSRMFKRGNKEQNKEDRKK